MSKEATPADLIPLGQAVRVGPPPARGTRRRSTVLRWILTGKLRGWRVLDRWYVSEAELQELLRPELLDVPQVEGARLRLEAVERQVETEKTLRRHGIR